MNRAALFLIVLGVTQVARAEPVKLAAFAQRADGTWLSEARDHVAISRELPRADGDSLEDEAVRLVFSSGDSAPPVVRISTRRASGALLDTLAEPKLSKAECPPGTVAGASCWATAALRLTPD